MVGKSVLLTNANSGAGLDAGRALAAAGYRVITTDFQRLPLGLRSRYSREHHVLPGTNQSDFENGLLALIDRLRPSVFLPLGTRSVFAASRHRESLATMTAINVPTLKACLAATDKTVCMAECHRLGIPCPAVYSQDQALAVFERDPEAMLVVKPDFDAGAASGVRYARNREELQTALQECTERFGGALIQDYIPGGPEAMKTVIPLFTRESVLVSAFTARKVRQWPETGGVTAAGCSTAEKHLVDMVLPFFEKWRWCGAAEVELKFDRRDGQHKVIEINPRFPGYLRFPGECGLNFPVMAVELALGGPAFAPGAFPEYVTGARYLNPGLFFLTVYSRLRRDGPKKAEIRDALREIRGAGPLLLRLLDDPLPMIGRALLRASRIRRPAIMHSMRADRQNLTSERNDSSAVSAETALRNPAG
ncbi:MAG: ATP-grasp domain-containing protein [Bryobacteraceae bacterium]|jgi:predicted ATP-grasp superfamily ATP-dependent carboligase